MRNPTVTLGLILALLTPACARAEELDELIERVGDERPEFPVLATLPPPWTPTPLPPIPQVSPTAVGAEPTPRPAIPTAEAPMEPLGIPWILYCDDNGEAALLDTAGSQHGALGTHCFQPHLVSSQYGFGVANLSILQIHNSVTVRPELGEAFGWSADGTVLVSKDINPLTGNQSLILYEVASDRYRSLAESAHELSPIAVSPRGNWVLYTLFRPADPQSGSTSEITSVMAVSADGRVQRELHQSRFGGYVSSEHVTWLSESSVAFSRTGSNCELDLLRANLATDSVSGLYGAHALAAADPDSQTIFLIPHADCDTTVAGSALVRMTAAGDWQPAEVPLPRELASSRPLTGLQWLPELGQFALWSDATRQDPNARLYTFTPDGRIQLRFSFSGSEHGSFGRVVPSPDGRWIIVGGPPPHGTRIYDAGGELVKVLRAGGLLSHGVLRALWLPDSSAVFMVPVGGAAVLRADQTRAWALAIADASASGGSSLSLFYPPELPYRWVCSGMHSSRLYPGDRVLISEEPPIPSRARLGPGLNRPVAGMLQPGERTTIIDGPVCTDDLVWWWLVGEAVRGWVAQGDETGAWMVPD